MSRNLSGQVTLLYSCSRWQCGNDHKAYDRMHIYTMTWSYIYIQLYTYSSELYNSRLELKQLIESIYNDHVNINIVSVQVAPITNMFLEEIPHFSWLCASFCLPLPHPFSSLAIHSLLAYIGLHALGLFFFRSCRLCHRKQVRVSALKLLNDSRCNTRSHPGDQLRPMESIEQSQHESFWHPFSWYTKTQWTNCYNNESQNYIRLI